MKKTAYIFAMAAILAAGCGKEVITPAEEEIPQTATLVFTPEYEMNVDVKSAEIGKSDIWCFLCTIEYDYDTGSNNYTYYEPIKQSEINGTSYLFNIPRKDNLYATFAIIPEGLDAKELEWEHNDQNYGNRYINLAQDLVTKEPFDLYMTSHNFTDGSRYEQITFDDSLNTSISRTLEKAIHHVKTRLKFTNMPEGITPESYIRKIHFKVGSMQQVTFTIDEMYDEMESTTTYKCADIYVNFSRSYSSRAYYNYLFYTIETTDNKIFYNPSYNYQLYNGYAIQQNTITIDYNSII